MSAKKRGGEQKPTAIVKDGSNDLKGVLKSLGGSQSDHWNTILANQTVQTLWLHSDADARVSTRGVRAYIPRVAGCATPTGPAGAMGIRT